MTDTAEHPIFTPEEIQLAPLVIERHITTTGVSELYEASSPLSAIALAVKISRPHPIARAALETEARVTPTIDSSHILPVLSSGSIHQPGSRWDGLPYIVSPYSEDKTLRDRAVTDLNSARGVVNIIRGAARGLRDIHAHGYVHCDVKEGNIFTTQANQGFVGDLGLAVPSGERLRTNEQAFVQPRTFGTLGFMSPEQMRSESMTPATDVFSLGVTAVYALTGHWPWEELQDEGRGIQRPFGEVYQAILGSKFQYKLPNSIPIDTRDALYGCLEPDPSDRTDIDTMAELRLPNRIAAGFNLIFRTYKL